MSDNFTEFVYCTIVDMEKERQAAHRAPSHILYRSLLSRLDCGEAELRNALNTLFVQNHIVVGRAFNDKYIHAKPM